MKKYLLATVFIAVSIQPVFAMEDPDREVNRRQVFSIYQSCVDLIEKGRVTVLAVTKRKTEEEYEALKSSNRFWKFAIDEEKAKKKYIEEKLKNDGKFYPDFNNLSYRDVERLKFAAQKYLNLCFKADESEYAAGMYPVVSSEKLKEAEEELQNAVELGNIPLEQIRAVYEDTTGNRYNQFAELYRLRLKVLQNPECNGAQTIPGKGIAEITTDFFRPHPVFAIEDMQKKRAEIFAIYQSCVDLMQNGLTTIPEVTEQEIEEGCKQLETSSRYWGFTNNREEAMRQYAIEKLVNDGKNYPAFSNVPYRAVESLKLTAQKYLNLCFKADESEYAGGMYPAVSPEKLKQAEQKLQSAVERLGKKPLEQIRAVYEDTTGNRYNDFAEYYDSRLRGLQDPANCNEAVEMAEGKEEIDFEKLSEQTQSNQ